MWYVVKTSSPCAVCSLTICPVQDEEGNYKLPHNEVDTIKRELIGLMIACPSTIQTQLGEAISIIADSDFWERWDTLVQVRWHLPDSDHLPSNEKRFGRILFLGSPRTTIRSTMECWRLRILFSLGGAHYSDLMPCTPKSTTCWAPSRSRSSASST
jgi:hypothetical protein